MRDPLKHSGPVTASNNGFNIIECIECGHKHIFPIPTDEELEHIYKHEYYTKNKPDYIEKDIEDRDWWEMTYNRRFEFFENNLTTHGRRLLDIGSGPGLFLEVGNKRNWESKGIEPNQKAAEHSIKRGLDICNMMFDSRSAELLGKFDAINMSLVLEHVANPSKVIELVYNQLNDGGLFCVAVPNDFSPFQLVLQNHLGFQPWWVAPPHHINYFNFKSMEKLLQRNGFSVIHQEATFPIEMFLLMGDNYIGNDSVGRSCHKKRINFEMALVESGQGHLLSEMYQSFASSGVGREVLMIAKKETKN